MTHFVLVSRCLPHTASLEAPDGPVTRVAGAVIIPTVQRGKAWPKAGLLPSDSHSLTPAV